ncbi:MAG: PHP domain-containing protein, partial [Bacteroidota bacterium]
MKRTGIQKYIVILGILFIIVLATFFHFQIHFENALSLRPEPEYGIKIDFWRILFEPFFGPLLYTNRSLYTLQELPLALLWLVIFYVFYSVIQVLRTPRNKKGIAIEKLVNLPLVLGLCFALFVLILFVPLPNNTIVNHSKDTILVTTHVHTEFSHDGLISQENLWEWHKRNGFDAFFITDHNHHDKTWEFVKDQEMGRFPGNPLV